MKHFVIFMVLVFGFISCSNKSNNSTKNSTKKKDSTEHVKINWSEDVYESVDLGLSVEWATENVRGTFRWGETTKGKYKYYRDIVIQDEDGFDRSVCGYTKYVVIPKKGNDMFCDNLDKLLPEDDAATANWGREWRTPTKEEFEELLKCKWESKAKNGVRGYKITGPNGNFIFLPAEHYLYMTASLINKKDRNDFQGDCWVYCLAESQEWKIGINRRDTTTYYKVRPVRNK